MLSPHQEIQIASNLIYISCHLFSEKFRSLGISLVRNLSFIEGNIHFMVQNDLIGFISTTCKVTTNSFLEMLVEIQSANCLSDDLLGLIWSFLFSIYEQSSFQNRIRSCKIYLSQFDQ